MNLTTLQNLKSWLSTTSTTDDALMSRLITQISGMIYAYLQRSSLIQQNCVDYRNGNGNRRMLLENWPVLSVSAVQVGAFSVPAAPTEGENLLQWGWFLNPWSGQPPGRAQAVDLRGYTYQCGLGNVAVSYIAGYVQQNEPQTIPSSPFQVTPNQPYGSWAADSGVTYAETGIPLTAVKSSPAQGQYVAPVYGTTNTYTFNAADANQEVLISYSYIPAPIEQACIELCSV